MNDSNSASASGPGSGWSYFNEDTGMEWAPDHPVNSGEVPDATQIKRMTLREFNATYPAQTAGELIAALSSVPSHTKVYGRHPPDVGFRLVPQDNGDVLLVEGPPVAVSLTKAMSKS